MTLLTWGSNLNGELGLGQYVGDVPDRSLQRTPLRVATTPMVNVACGEHFTAGISVDGRLWTWGSGKFGRLGGRDTVDRRHPTAIDHPPRQWVTVACGTAHMSAINTTGVLHTCGCNVSGQLGDNRKGPSTYELTPVTEGIPPGVTVVSVACGYDHTVVLLSNGVAGAFGANHHGQVTGRPGREDAVPIALLDLPSEVTSVSAGQHCTAVVTRDGSLWMCGWRVGTRRRFPALTRIVLPTQCVSAALPDRITVNDPPKTGHVVALGVDGSVWTWGRNDKGQLGRTTPEGSDDTPDQVQNLAGPVAHVGSGGLHSAALLRDGTLQVWGCGSDGRLGLPGYTPDRHRWTYHEETPTTVLGGVTTFSTSNFHMACLQE